MSIESNKALLRREQEEFWGQGSEAIATELFAAQVIEADVQIMTPDDLIAVQRRQRSAAPDLQVRVLDMLGEGDRVMARIEASGTHQGEWAGIAATGRHFTISGMVMRQVVDGKIVARWDNLDMLAVMQQIGALASR